jgi:transcriptional regulator with XRE-family HTH domain
MHTNTDSLSVKVGSTIKSLRLKRNWKQKDIAERLSISVASFSKIEAGLTIVSLSRLQQIADLYDVTLQYMISGIHNNQQQQFTDTLETVKSALVAKEEEVRMLQERAISLYDQLNKKRKDNKAKSA